MTNHRWTEDDYSVMALAVRDEHGLVHSPPGDGLGAKAHRDKMALRVTHEAFIQTTEPLAAGAAASWQITDKGRELLKTHQEEKTHGDS